MRLDKIDIVYFLGIGGIGMSALARWFNVNGKKVMGYDKTETDLTQQLQLEGIEVNYTDEVSAISSNVLNDKSSVLIVLTPAVPSDSKQLTYLRDNGFDIKKRSEVLGLISKDHFTIGVAGTHGKTTTSSMLAHLLKSAGVNVTAFLGGITQNYNSNLILGDANKDQVVVVEADEFDRSFLRLSPDMSVVTTSDPDHLDIYGDVQEFHKGFREYVSKLPENGFLVVSDKVDKTIYEGVANYSVYSYDAEGAHAENICFENGYLNFDYVGSEKIKGCSLLVPGIHNVENAIAAISIALKLNVVHDKIREGLKSFLGVKRRFEYHIRENNLVYVDDYAHHPSEIRSFVKSLRLLYPGRKVTLLFQPHLFSRTQDFMDGFAESLSLADEVLLLDIYPARELPIEGVTAEVLLEKMTLENAVLMTKDEVVDYVSTHDFEVFATVGAGDVNRLIVPIKDRLLNSKKIAL